MKQHTRYLRSIVLLCVLAVSLAVAQGDEPEVAELASPPPSRWTPQQIERDRYDDIVAYNIFHADRAALAAQAQRQPEPTENIGDTEPIEPVVEFTPPDPDALLVLVGVSIHGPVATAHIENLATGDVICLIETGPFSQGEIQAITIQGLTYRVDGNTRHIDIGQALTGESPDPVTAPPSTTTSNTDDQAAHSNTNDATQSPPPDDGLSNLERRMRERRNSE